MKKKFKISPFLILRLLGIILFVYILTRVDLKRIGEVLREMNLQMFMLGILFQILVLLFKGFRWHIMNDGRKQKTYWIRSFGRFFESYAVGVVTPGRLGELLKAGHEESSVGKVNSFIRVISERGFDVSIFVLIAVGALFFGNFISMEEWLKWIFLGAGLIILILSYLLLSSSGFLLFIQKLVSKFSRNNFLLEINSKHYSKGIVPLILFLSVLSNFSYFVSCYYLAQSVYLSIPLIDVSAGVALAGLLNMLPITIMGLGTRELVLLSVFSAFPKSAVLAFSITILLVAQIGGGIFAMVLGQIFLFIDKKKK